MELDANGEEVGAMQAPRNAQMNDSMISPPPPPQILPLMEQQPQIQPALMGQQPQVQPTAARSMTSYTKAEQVAAIDHYLGVLHGKDRASLYTWFAITFRKSLKAGTFTLWLKNKDTIFSQFRAGRADPGRTGSHARLRESITQGLGRQLYDWCQSSGPRQMVITDSLLKNQAKIIVAEMEKGKDASFSPKLLDPKLFNFSENWLLRWKKVQP